MPGAPSRRCGKLPSLSLQQPAQVQPLRRLLAAAAAPSPSSAYSNDVPARRTWLPRVSNLVIEGDSLSDTAWQTTTNGQTSWVSQIDALLPEWDVTNLAHVGDTVWNHMMTDGASVDAAYAVGAAANVLVLWGGTNDMGDDGRTPTQAWTAVRDWCLARRAAHPGWRIIVLNCIYGNGIAAATTEAYNALLAVDHSFCDELIDICSLLGKAADHPLYFLPDNTHIRTFASSIVADMVRQVLAAPAPPLALEVNAGGRYVQTANATPFLLHGEAAWLLQVLNIDAVRAYLDNLVTNGVNVIRVFGPMPPGAITLGVSDANGNYAFTTPADFTTSFDNEWWDHLEAIISAAQARGIVVALQVLYFGWSGEDWGTVMSGKTATEHQTYATAVATRLAGHPNLIYDLMGDGTPPEPTRTSALAAGLRSAGPARLLTAQPARLDGFSSVLQPSGGNWDLQFVYPRGPTYSPPGTTYEQCLDGYAENVGPCIDFEPFYEWSSATLRHLREQVWQAATCGAPSYCYGNEKIYNFDVAALETNNGGLGSGVPYTASYNDPGRLAFRAFGNFLRTIEWWRLVPDTGASLVTAGRGTYGTSNTSYVTVAKASSAQNLALIYIPTGASITVDLSGFSGPVTARWIDPATGASSAASGSPLAAAGTHAFVASSEKGSNSAGDPDWVLVLTS